MNDEQIKQALETIAGLAHEALTVVREDRHNRASRVMAVEFECDSLTFEQLSQIAGAFMTPNIDVQPFCAYRDEPFEYTIAKVKITCRAPGAVEQLLVEGTPEPMPAVEDFDSEKTREYGDYPDGKL